MLTVHRNILISGTVQGVGFRFHAVTTARSLGVKGFVKNLSDGKVYIEVEGTPEQIDNFINWCYQGPPRSRVHNVSIQEESLKNFKGFDVRF
jgi:acylphosphatase